MQHQETEKMHVPVDEDAGDGCEKNLEAYTKKDVEGAFGNASTLQRRLDAQPPDDEPDEPVAHAAVQELERLHAEIQGMDMLKHMSKTGEPISNMDMSQCVCYSPRGDRYKPTAQAVRTPPHKTPETVAARHKKESTKAERARRSLIETNLDLTVRSLSSDTASASAHRAKGQSEQRKSAAVVRGPDPRMVRDVSPIPQAHRRRARTQTQTQQGAQAQLGTSSGERQQQQKQQQKHYRPAPEENASATPPVDDTKPKKIPTKTAFSKRANKKAGWKVKLPPGHSTRPPGIFNSQEKMLERQRQARLQHALHARHHTGTTPPLRGNWYRKELARVAEEVARIQTAEPPSRAADEPRRPEDAAQRRRRHVRIQEPAGSRAATARGVGVSGAADGGAARAVRAPQAAAPREPCAGCHQAKRSGKKLIRKYGFCFRCLRKHLVNLGELRSCVECRQLRVKEDYFIYDTYGAKQKETRNCAACRWSKKKKKCRYLCGRPG